MKKAVVVWVAVLFMLPLHFVFANLVINEIMYAPSIGSDYEWVEIFNSGSTSIDLNNYRFFHGETNSGPLTLRNGSTAVLQPSEYAIIAKSQTNYAWLNFSGMILSASTVSLPDSGDNTYIAISDSNKVILNYVKYDTSLGGSKESGNSLQKISNAWQGRIPTPGTANETISSSSSNDNNFSNQSTSAPQNKTTAEPKESKIKTKITANTLAFVGIPLSFEAKAFSKQGELLHDGKYFFNFGDGDSKEIKTSEDQKFMHTYFYTGEYIATLEYYANYYGNTPDASDKMVIKVVPADIAISKVGDEKDFFVELSNNTSYDTDISNWILISGAKSFMIPRNTIITSKNKLIISSKITNFSILDKDSLKLMTAQGSLAFDYGTLQATPKSPPPSPLLHKEGKNPLPLRRGSAEGEGVNSSATEEQIPPADLTSSALSSDVGTDNPMRAYILATVMTLFLGISAGGVYFIRQKKIVSGVGSDFEILDE